MREGNQGGRGVEMIDRQRAAVKRPRLQEKHAKITWQQQCHKIQGLVLSVRIRERRRREPGASCVEESDEVCATVCDACVCVCRREEGLMGKEPRLSLQKKSLSCVIGAVPLSPRYLLAQTGYHVLCASWLCNWHQVSAAQLWPAFFSPLPPSKLTLIGIRSTNGPWGYKKTL